MQLRSENLRAFFAQFVCSASNVKNTLIEEAFKTVEREIFAGPGPWSIAIAGQYIVTPNDDPAFLYQDTLVALDAKRLINIGQPSSHALWLNAVSLQQDESVLQVGAGTGYYTAIMAHLVGTRGHVYAYEIDETLAKKARANLLYLSQVEVKAQSGMIEDLPKVDAVYVCAGITQPSWAWINALKPGGRLLFPLQPKGSWGGMLLVKRPEAGSRWPAKFVSRARFIDCVGWQDEEAGERLKRAFEEDWSKVKSFCTNDDIDDTCWFAKDGWWLSTAPPEDKWVLPA